MAKAGCCDLKEFQKVGLTVGSWALSSCLEIDAAQAPLRTFLHTGNL